MHMFSLKEWNLNKWSDGFTGTTLYMQHVLGGLDYQKFYIIETFS